jgi:hypothetical protein
MIAIFVKASWLAEIGDMADEMILRQEADAATVSLLAGEARPGYPFVDAMIARRENPKTEQIFLPVQIPADVVRGIFDLTEGEEKKYGFIRS